MTSTFCNMMNSDKIIPPAETNLNIAGMIKYSTVDWPDRGVATLFLQGCPFRCGYCHNYEILDINKKGELEFSEVIEFLNRRKGLLDGVVFSGGEPTIQPQSINAIKYVNSMGFDVGIHTYGSNPSVFKAVLPYLTWVGFDIKAPVDLYDKVTNTKKSAVSAMKSLDLLLKSGVDYQLRTTFDKTVLSENDIERIKQELKEKGADLSKYKVQEVQLVNVTKEYKEKYLKALNDYKKT